MSKGREQASSSGEIQVESANSLSINEIAPYWLAALIDSADDAIISKTLDGIITSWNKGAERIFGYTADEAIGKPVLMLIPPDHQNEEPNILKRIRAGERVEHFETVRVRKDGRLIDISLTISPIKTPDGRIIGASKIARDITDLKQAEAALRDSENQLRQITDAIPVLISYVDRDQYYRFVNRSYKEWFGYSTEQVVGRHIRDVIGEDAYRLVLPRIERVLAGERFDFEQLMPYPNGKEVYIYVNYIPSVDEETGEIRGFYALVRDVTESKKAEIRLRESEARFAKAFSSSPLVLTISSLKTGKLLEVNDTFVETTGFSREEAIGRTTVELGLWAKARDREEEMETVRRRGHIRNAEYVFRVKGGKEIIGLLSAEHIEIGGESFALTVIQDITERKQAEEKLRAGEERYRMLFDSIDQGFCLCEILFDAAHKPVDYRFLEVNPAFEKMTGIPNAEAITGHTARELVSNLEDKWVNIYGQVALTGEPVRFIDDSQAMSGRWFDVYAFRVGGETSRKVAIFFNNVTERKRTEQEREELLRREQTARREAEEANRLKDEFLATVSHELRTPLNAILGWSQMLRSGNFTHLDSSRAVETIYRNAKSQAQLIEDILDVSRIITGKLRLEPQPILLAPVIQSAVETLRPAIEAKNIRLQMRLNFEPRTVYADPDRLQQVIWNLLSNAIKFTPEKGEVTIALDGDETETRIIVSDTGKGISGEFLPFVFERFRQADGSSTRKHGGLGLGLAIVRHIVELHGGSIEAGSAGENAGTTFTVRLPLKDSRVKISKKSAAEIPPTETAFADKTHSIAAGSKIKGLRVLLVDDEADTLELLGVFLNQNGAEVKAETSARAALEIIKEWQPDVIVSDIAMPEEDGYSFIKKLRALPPERGGAIPVIALTAYVGIKERTQVLSNGFQMYVPKPVEPSELLEALVNFTEA